MDSARTFILLLSLQSIQLVLQNLGHVYDVKRAMNTEARDAGCQRLQAERHQAAAADVEQIESRLSAPVRAKAIDARDWSRLKVG